MTVYSPSHPKVDCPRCGAPAGYPCNAATEGVFQAVPHLERLMTEVDELRAGLRQMRRAYMEYCEDDNIRPLAVAFDETRHVC